MKDVSWYKLNYAYVNLIEIYISKYYSPGMLINNGINVSEIFALR